MLNLCKGSTRLLQSLLPMSSTNEHFVQGADLLKLLPLVPTQFLAKSLPTLGYSLSYGWLKQAGIYPESCTHEAYIQPVDAATELITALAPCIYSKRLKYASLGKLVADCCQVSMSVRLLLRGNAGFLRVQRYAYATYMELGTGPIHGTVC